MNPYGWLADRAIQGGQNLLGGMRTYQQGVERQDELDSLRVEDKPMPVYTAPTQRPMTQLPDLRSLFAQSQQPGPLATPGFQSGLTPERLVGSSRVQSQPALFDQLSPQDLLALQRILTGMYPVAMR